MGLFDQSPSASKRVFHVVIIANNGMEYSRQLLALPEGHPLVRAKARVGAETWRHVVLAHCGLARTRVIRSRANDGGGAVMLLVVA